MRFLRRLACRLLQSHATVEGSGRFDGRRFSVLCARCDRRVGHDEAGRWIIGDDIS